MTIELSDCDDSESGIEVQGELINQDNKINRPCYRISSMLILIIIFLIWSTLIIVIPEIMMGIHIDGYDKIGIMIGFLLLGLVIVTLLTVVTKTVIDTTIVRYCIIIEV